MSRVVNFLGLLLGLLALPSLGFAQKDKLVNVESGAVFQAAVEVAKDHYTVVAVNREEMILSYRTPAGMRAATGYDVTATFERRPDGCGGEGRPACAQTLIRLSVSKRHAVFTWGGGDAAAKDFFRWIEERLASPPRSAGIGGKAWGGASFLKMLRSLSVPPELTHPHFARAVRMR